MTRARLIITAITVEQISQAEAARRYGVSPGWVSKLMSRFRTEGNNAFTKRTTRPHPSAVPPDTTGVITFRHAGKLHHIGIGRPHKNTRVIILIDGLEIRVVDQQTGELLRELTIDTSRDYQPQK